MSHPVLYQDLHKAVKKLSGTIRHMSRVSIKRDNRHSVVITINALFRPLFFDNNNNKVLIVRDRDFFFIKTFHK